MSERLTIKEAAGRTGRTEAAIRRRVERVLEAEREGSPEAMKRALRGGLRSVTRGEGRHKRRLIPLEELKRIGFLTGDGEPTAPAPLADGETDAAAVALIVKERELTEGIHRAYEQRLTEERDRREQLQMSLREELAEVERLLAQVATAAPWHRPRLLREARRRLQNRHRAVASVFKDE
jgi:hypothetical protein